MPYVYWNTKPGLVGGYTESMGEKKPALVRARTHTDRFQCDRVLAYGVQDWRVCPHVCVCACALVTTVAPSSWRGGGLPNSGVQFPLEAPEEGTSHQTSTPLSGRLLVVNAEI